MERSIIQLWHRPEDSFHSRIEKLYTNLVRRFSIDSVVGVFVVVVVDVVIDVDVVVVVIDVDVQIPPGSFELKDRIKVFFSAAIFLDWGKKILVAKYFFYSNLDCHEKNP